MKAWISANSSGWGTWMWVAHLDGTHIQATQASQLAKYLRRAGVVEIGFAPAEDSPRMLGPRLQAAMQSAWEQSASIR